MFYLFYRFNNIATVVLDGIESDSYLTEKQIEHLEEQLQILVKARSRIIFLHVKFVFLSAVVLCVTVSFRKITSFQYLSFNSAHVSFEDRLLAIIHSIQTISPLILLIKILLNLPEISTAIYMVQVRCIFVLKWLK